jgi:hypothetical protein
MKVKSLVIVNENVTVKVNRALHTPPITLGEVASQNRMGGSGLSPRTPLP